MNLKTHPIAWIVRPEDATIFDEQAFEIRVEDEGGGSFLAVKSYADETKSGEIRIDDDCWPALKDSIETALKVVEEIDKDTEDRRTSHDMLP